MQENRMDMRIIQTLAQTILTRYGTNATHVAAHAARQAQRNGDADGVKQWNRVHQSIETMSNANTSTSKIDIVV